MPRVVPCLPRLRGWAALCATALALAALPATAREDDRGLLLFTQWQTARPDVHAFDTFLKREKLDRVAPLHQLLRSASMWRECKAGPFEVPPPHQWNDVRDVLRLLDTLRTRKILPRYEVVSGYRSPTLNKCAGGAPRSAHTAGFAVDLAPLSREQAVALCKFWRTEGKAWKMGVSRYPTGRIHLDRSGWRTWGSDHTRRTSFCA